MKIIAFCILFLLATCMPVFPNPKPQILSQLWFGSYAIANNYIFVKVTYLNEKKEIIAIIGENEKELLILTEKGKMGIRFKKDMSNIDVLRIKKKGEIK